MTGSRAKIKGCLPPGATFRASTRRMSWTCTSVFSATRSRWTRRRASISVFGRRRLRPLAVRPPPSARPARGRLPWRWARSTWRSPSVGTATSQPTSTRSATFTAAIPCSCPNRTASPRPTCAVCPPRSIKGPAAEGAKSMWDVIERLRKIYCSTTGYDIAHIFVPEERIWLREAIETGRFIAPADPIDPHRAARPAHAGRSLRAIPAPDVSRQDALLDRRARHARADARRGDRGGGRGRHAPGASSAWRTAAG